MLDDEFIRQHEQAHKEIMERFAEEEIVHRKLLERVENVEVLVTPLKDLAATGRVGAFVVKLLLGIGALAGAVLALRHLFDKAS